MRCLSEAILFCCLPAAAGVDRQAAKLLKNDGKRKGYIRMKIHVISALVAVCLLFAVGGATAAAERDAGMAALRQEKQLLADMEEKSAVVLDNDAQQLMFQTFGKQFTPAALNDIPDKLLRDQLQTLRRDGYTFLQAEGMYYLAVDYQALLNDYESELDQQVHEYLRLQAEETAHKTFQDGGIAVDRKLLGQRALAAEGFLRRYANSYRRSEISDLYFAYASAFLFGTDNSRIADNKGVLRQDVAAAWKHLVKEQPNTALARYVKELQAAQEAPFETRGDLYKAVRTQLIETVYPTHEGVYSGERGQASLLTPDGSVFFIEDRFGAAQRAYEVINENESVQPVLMTVRGAVNQSLPDNGWASFYGKTIVVDRVSNVSHWDLDDATMPFVLAGVGVEPFWNVRVLENGFVFFSLLDEPVQLFAAPIKEILPDGFRYGLKRADGATLVITVRRVAGGVQDGMSDNIYPCSVTIVFNGKTFKGCGFTQTEKIQRHI